MSTARWTALGKRLGPMHLLRTRDEGRLFGRLGPDVLGTDSDAAEAAGRLGASRATIGVLRHAETSYVHGRSGRPCRR
ncbi:MAG TPA: hypothetical protein VIJ15_01340 [Dermatophilaceae bacterium]